LDRDKLCNTGGIDDSTGIALTSCFALSKYEQDNAVAVAVAVHDRNQAATADILTSVFWSDICVGDLLYIKNNDKIPADVILLTSSDVASGSGAVYIETANIDGETNLKIRISALAGIDKIPGSGTESGTGTGTGLGCCAGEDQASARTTEAHWFPSDVQR
jgi:P-type E1-E2 ATPase